MTIQLTKKEISGYGSYHQFLNLATNEIVYVKCLDTDYIKMGGKDGDDFNPTLDGHKWVGSISGVPEVENRFITNGEYIKMPSGYTVAMISNKVTPIKESDIGQNGDYSPIN